MSSNSTKYSKYYYEKYIKPWRLENKEKFNSTRRKYYHDVIKFKEFGITKEEYNTMLEKQNNVCAICGNKQIYKKEKELCIDHNHKTGKVRGLLCEKCNWALGLFDENIGTMKKAIKYLNKYTSIDIDVPVEEEEEEIKDE